MHRSPPPPLPHLHPNNWTIAETLVNHETLTSARANNFFFQRTCMQARPALKAPLSQDNAINTCVVGFNSEPKSASWPGGQDSHPPFSEMKRLRVVQKSWVWWSLGKRLFLLQSVFLVEPTPNAGLYVSGKGKKLEMLFCLEWWPKGDFRLVLYSANRREG